MTPLMIMAKLIVTGLIVFVAALLMARFLLELLND